MTAVVQGLGAAAGLAGIVGLAVLAALYRAQARDVRWLREWAGTAPERAAPAVAARPRRRIGVRAVAAAAAGLLVLGIGAAALTGGGGGGDGDGRPGRPRAQSKTDNKPRRAGPAVEPGAVTVAVLNGTTVPGLARALRARLVAAGFREGMIDVFGDQQLATSVVQYGPGQEAAARAVGRRLGIGAREPVTGESRALAGDATVIVIAGADRAP